MPVSTDLVTDLPADFEVFGQAVATSMADLLGGTTGQFLSKTTNTDMDFTWAGQNVSNWSLVNSGGTALTAATTITVSGISSADKILILVSGASSVSANSVFSLRFNADAGNNYSAYGFSLNNAAAYSTTSMGAITTAAANAILFGQMSSNVAGTVSGYALLSGTNTAGLKVYNSTTGSSAGGGNSNFIISQGGTYSGTSAISSVSIISSTGNFDAGTIFVYKSNY